MTHITLKEENHSFSHTGRLHIAGKFLHCEGATNCAINVLLRTLVNWNQMHVFCIKTEICMDDHNGCSLDAGGQITMGAAGRDKRVRVEPKIRTKKSRQPGAREEESHDEKEVVKKRPAIALQEHFENRALESSSARPDTDPRPRKSRRETWSPSHFVSLIFLDKVLWLRYFAIVRRGSAKIFLHKLPDKLTPSGQGGGFTGTVQWSFGRFKLKVWDGRRWVHEIRIGGTQKLDGFFASFRRKVGKKSFNTTGPSPETADAMESQLHERM
eukprot:s4805_g6.t1